MQLMKLYGDCRRCGSVEQVKGKRDGAFDFIIIEATGMCL